MKKYVDSYLSLLIWTSFEDFGIKLLAIDLVRVGSTACSDKSPWRALVR